MRVVSRPRLAAYGIAPLVVLLDQTSKAWVLQGLHLTRGMSIDILGPLRLTLVSNGGVSFGLLQGEGLWGRWGLAAFSMAVVVALAVWLKRIERPSTGLAVGLIMGGAVGNVVDRIRFGAVVDFIDFQRWFFPWIFNVADSAISVGVAILLIESLFSSRRAAG